MSVAAPAETEREAPTTPRSRKCHVIDVLRPTHTLCGLQITGKTFTGKRHWIDCANCSRVLESLGLR